MNRDKSYILLSHLTSIWKLNQCIKAIKKILKLKITCYFIQTKEKGDSYWLEEPGNQKAVSEVGRRETKSNYQKLLNDMTFGGMF